MNLVNTSIEKLENLPSRQKFYEGINTRMSIVRRVEYRPRARMYYKMAKHIVRGCSGLTEKEILYKIKQKIHRNRGFLTPTYLLDINVNNLITINDKEFTIDRRIGSGALRVPLDRKGNRWTETFLDYDNTVTTIRAKVKKYTWYSSKEYYERMALKRKKKQGK